MQSKNELDTYKYLLKVAEEIFETGGFPNELFIKYKLLKNAILKRNNLSFNDVNLIRVENNKKITDFFIKWLDYIEKICLNLMQDDFFYGDEREPDILLKMKNVEKALKFKSEEKMRLTDDNSKHIQKINESFQNEKNVLILKIKTLQTQIQTQNNAYNDLQNKSKLAEEQYNRIIKDLQRSIQDLEGSYEASLAEMLNIKKESALEGDYFLLFLKEKILKYKDIYKEFVDDNSSSVNNKNKEKWNFLNYLIEKFEKDNIWLLENLQHFKNELEIRNISIPDGFNNEKNKDKELLIKFRKEFAECIKIEQLLKEEIISAKKEISIIVKISNKKK